MPNTPETERRQEGWDACRNAWPAPAATRPVDQTRMAACSGLQALRHKAASCLPCLPWPRPPSCPALQPSQGWPAMSSYIMVMMRSSLTPPCRRIWYACQAERAVGLGLKGSGDGCWVLGAEVPGIPRSNSLRLMQLGSRGRCRLGGGSCRSLLSPQSAPPSGRLHSVRRKRLGFRTCGASRTWAGRTECNKPMPWSAGARCTCRVTGNAGLRGCMSAGRRPEQAARQVALHWRQQCWQRSREACDTFRVISQAAWRASPK